MAIIKKTTVVKVTPAKKMIVTSRKPIAKKAAAPIPSSEEREEMIKREAFFIAEKQGFQGDPQAHWIEAEKRIDALLSK